MRHKIVAWHKGFRDTSALRPHGQSFLLALLSFHRLSSRLVATWLVHLVGPPTSPHLRWMGGEGGFSEIASVKNIWRILSFPAPLDLGKKGKRRDETISLSFMAKERLVGVSFLSQEGNFGKHILASFQRNCTMPLMIFVRKFEPIFFIFPRASHEPFHSYPTTTCKTTSPPH